MSTRRIPRLIAAQIRRVLLYGTVGLLWIAGGEPLLPANAESTSQTFDVVAVIEPELSLSIVPETGERVDFGTIYSSETEPRLSKAVRVDVHVFSNLGRPYQVTQQFLEPLTNHQGLTLEPEQLLVSSPDALSALAAPSGVAAAHPHVLFSSDPQGRSANRSLTYQLRVPPAQAAGTYQGTILMTVTAQ